MFDFIGWSELLVIAVVAIIVVGPRELPALLRSIGKTMGQLKRTADDFRRQFDDAIKETELDQIKSSFDETAAEIKDPMTEFEKSVKGDFDEIERSFRDPGAETDDDEPELLDNKAPEKKSVAERAKEAEEAHAQTTDDTDPPTDNVTPLRKQA